MKILALDLGKYKSVACVLDTLTLGERYVTIATTAQALHDLVVEEEPGRIVLEICSITGWVVDLLRGLEHEPEVANTNGDAWKWKKVKKKTDRMDALKLARLSALGQISLVHVPEREIRQWRQLINYRQRLVQQRTRAKNRIRELLNSEGLGQARGRKAWSAVGREELAALAQPVEKSELGDLWRGILELELEALDTAERLLGEVEKKLNELNRASAGAQLLQTIPGVGPRLSEALVTALDKPERFKRGKEVGAYFGMVPKQFQSGESQRLGRITRAGNRNVRSLLVEVGWLGQRYNPWLREVYTNVHRGSKARKKIAVVAVGRRLAICCWAMLRDGTVWRAPVKGNEVAPATPVASVPAARSAAA
jgi:transposase